MLKDDIAVAASQVLREHGLQGWSVDRVATLAGCAKGLVSYHHGSKRALLGAVAARLRRESHDGRLAALSATGAEALDRLWHQLAEEVRRGDWAASAALAAAPDVDTPRELRSELAAFRTSVAAALDLPAFQEADARLASAALDGFQRALHLGAPAESVHEAYHRLWLAFLP